MTNRAKVVLTRWQRKERLGHGGVKEVADEAQVDPALVSRVVNDKQRHDGVEQIIARKIGKPGELVFPPRSMARAS